MSDDDDSERTIESRLSELEIGLTRVLLGEATLPDDPEFLEGLHALWTLVAFMLVALILLFLIVASLAARMIGA